MVPPENDNRSPSSPPAGQLVGRCEMFDAIARGSMATIHLGRMVGAGGFSRTVAIKRLHPQFAADKDFAAKLRDEARLLARIRHPNVVPMLDLVEEEGNLYLILEYVEGVNLGLLLALAEKKGERVPPAIGMRIAVGVLHGLHAAHEATDERGELLKIVHRDVSPHNILVGTDGFTRLLDFGTARALGQLGASRTGQAKKRSSYLSPEQVKAQPVDHRSDVFGAAVVMWEMLTGRKLFDAKEPIELVAQITERPITAPSQVAEGVPRKWDGLVLRGLDRSIHRRWKSAMAMADAIEAIGGLAQQREVGDWAAMLGAERIQELSEKVMALEAKPVRAETKRRVHPRSQLNIDRTAIEAAIAEAKTATELDDETSEHDDEPTGGDDPFEREPPGAQPGEGTQVDAANGEDEEPDDVRPLADDASEPDEPRAQADEAPASPPSPPRRTLVAVATEAPASSPRRRGKLLWAIAAAGVIGVATVAIALGSGGGEEPNPSAHGGMAAHSGGSGGPATSPAGASSAAPSSPPSHRTSAEPLAATADASVDAADPDVEDAAAPDGADASAPPSTATATAHTTRPPGTTKPPVSPGVPLYSRD